MRRAQYGRVGLAVAFALLVAGVAPVARAQSNDQITIAIEQDPNTLNPVLFRGGTDWDLEWPLFDSLVESGPDLTPRPLLAESWSVSADGLSYTFKLRKDVKWHDGKPFTAEDVAFTFYAHLDPKVNSTYRPQLSNLVGFEKLTDAEKPASPDSLPKKPIEVLDPYTVRFNLVTPNAAFLTILTNPRGGIVPKHVFEGTDFNTAAFNRSPIGTGPFTFVEWRRGEAIVLQANPTYHEGAPALRRVIFRIVPERAQQLGMIRSGEIQFTRSVPLDAVPDLKARPDLQVIAVPEVNWRGMLFNLKRPALKDRRVRFAIAHAIDRDLIVRAIGRGFLTPANGPIPPGSWAYNADVSMPAHDEARAKALLAEAGKLPTLTMIVENFEVLPDVAVAIQEQLGRVGIKVEIEKMDFAAWLERLRRGDYDLSMVSFGGAADPDIVASISFHSTGGRNLNGYDNKTVDDLLEKARRTQETKERRAAYVEVQRILADELPALFLYHSQRVYVVNAKYRGWERVPVTMGMFQSLRRVRVTP